MPRTFRRRERLSALSEINVTPLIDLAFSLLIIFMITAPLLEQTIAVNLPEETAKPQAAKEEPVQNVSIDGQGVYYWSGRPATLEEISGLLEDLAARPDPPVIHLRADRALPYQKVINLIDLIQRHELVRISLDTRAQ